MKVKEKSEKAGLKLYIQKMKIMPSSPITSWQIDGETMETVTDFLLLDSKITADGDCSHEIKRCLVLGRKAMTNLDSVFKSRDITLPTKICIVKAIVFPVVTYGCDSWTIKKAEHRRIDAFFFFYIVLPVYCYQPISLHPMDCSPPGSSVHRLFQGRILEWVAISFSRIDAFKLWCWRRLLRVPWTARRSNQLILKEITPEYSLEGLMLKLKLQYFGHLMQRANSFEKTLMLGKTEGRRRRGRKRMR